MQTKIHDQIFLEIANLIEGNNTKLADLLIQNRRILYCQVGSIIKNWSINDI